MQPKARCWSCHQKGKLHCQVWKCHQEEKLHYLLWCCHQVEKLHYQTWKCHPEEKRHCLTLSESLTWRDLEYTVESIFQKLECILLTLEDKLQKYPKLHPPSGHQQSEAASPYTSE